MPLLVAVFWQDTYHSGRDPDLMEGVVHCNGLASIQGCKGFALFVWLSLGGIRVGLNLFMNLEGCQIGVANSGRNGGPNLALVQELSRWQELGINRCSSECQKGELWVSTTVLSTLECMLHGFYTCLCKSIWLQVVRAWGLMCDTQEVQNSVNYALTYWGPLSEQSTLGIPCSDNISLSSKTTLTALLWPDGRCQMRIIFE